MKIFWQPQSDIPVATGRDFVTLALSQAIAALRSGQAADTAVSQSHNIELDCGNPVHDPDTPDKIDAAAVFIADATPAGDINRQTDGRDNKAAQTADSVIAFTVGYALKALGKKRLILVCNRHYGMTNALPCNLRDTIASVFYDLAPDADEDTRKKVLGTLANTLKTKINTCLPPVKLQADAFSGVPDNRDTGAFFAPDEILAKIPGLQDTLDCTFQDGTCFCLRVIPPVQTLEKPPDREKLRTKIQDSGLKPFATDNTPAYYDNQYGTIVITAGNRAKKIDAFTQVFDTGEVWGMTTTFNDPPNRQKKLYMPGELVEEKLRQSLYLYVSFIKNHLGIRPPVGVKFSGKNLHGHGMTQKGRRGLTMTTAPFQKGAFGQAPVILDSFEQESLDKGVHQLLDQLWQSVRQTP